MKCEHVYQLLEFLKLVQPLQVTTRNVNRKLEIQFSVLKRKTGSISWATGFQNTRRRVTLMQFVKRSAIPN